MSNYHKRDIANGRIFADYEIGFDLLVSGYDWVTVTTQASCNMGI